MAVLSMMESSDDVLVEAARHSPVAFGVIYDRYVDAIYTYVRYRVEDEGDVEDLTAQTFQHALAGLPAYQSRGLPFGAWLYRIAHNLVANWHRRQGRHPEVSFEGLEEEKEGAAQVAFVDLSPAPGPGTEVGEVEIDALFDRQILLQAMARLGEDRQALLIYKFNQGLSNAEIASILGRSEGAIKSLYHRTLLELRAQLDPAAASATASEVDHDQP